MPKLYVPATPPSAASVTAAEIIRNFGHWQHKALEAPLAITHHGRARVMLISAQEYERLAARRPARPSNDSAELLQFIDNAAEGFMAHDGDLRLSQMNRVAENYFGRHQAELLGLKPDDPLHSPGNAYIHSIMRNVLVTGATVAFEADSKVFPGRRISARTFPYKDGIATLFKNITERERLRAGAESSKAIRLAVRESGEVAAVRLDMRGWLESADPVFTAMTGFEAADLNGIRLISAVAPRDRRIVQQFFDEISLQVKSGVFTAGIIVKSGEERRFKIAAVPMLRNFALKGVMVLMTKAEPSG